MKMDGRFGLAVENFTPAEKEPDIDAVVAYARRAEELGFTSLWVYDHMLLGTRRPFPFLESLTTLTALAMVTEKVRLGTGVLVLALRNPVVLAKTATTLDHVSKGRLTLGMAAGWYEREFDACGVPFRKRGRIVEHNLDVLERFWTGELVSGEQDGIPYRNALMLPKPYQRPRPELLLGGYVDKVLRRVATRSDGWLTYFYDADAFAHAWKTILGYADEAGRDPTQLKNVAQVAICVDDSYEAADRRVREYIATYFDIPEWSQASVEHAVRGTPAQCAEQLAAYFAAGVQHVCLMAQDYDPEQVERIAAEVLPQLEGVEVAR